MSKNVIRSRSAALGVLEAAHASGSDAADWLEGIGRALEGMLHAPTGVAVVILERLSDRYRVWRAEGTDLRCSLRLPRVGAAEYEDAAGLVEVMPLLASDAYYQRALVGTRAEVHARLEVGTDDPSEAVLSSIGMQDALGVNGRAGCQVINVSSAFKERLLVSAADRQFLSQIALHLGTGLALRQDAATKVAVINPDGRLIHAVGAVRERAVVEPIVRHVRAIERARSRRRRGSPEALEAWRALVDGRWGLAEHVDSDGSRHYVALETAAGFSPLRALSSVEAKVLELSARGVSGKLVSYALGISAGRVSQSLQSCALKIGCATRTEVVRVAAALLDQRSELGASSQHTVANQVASLLRKFEVPSRRALVSSAPTRQRARNGVTLL